MYCTVIGEAYGEFVEKRSRFICYGKHVENEEEATDYLSHIKSKNWDARHNVYAYKILEGNISRFCDDGEPQGTAGSRILGVLDGLNLVNVIVVVTRYFGGVLLGTGGLSRAYSHGAVVAVEACGISKMTYCVSVKIRADYGVHEKIKRFADEAGAKIYNCEYSEFVDIYIRIDELKYDELECFVNHVSGGGAEMVIVDKGFYCL